MTAQCFQPSDRAKTLERQNPARRECRPAGKHPLPFQHIHLPTYFTGGLPAAANLAFRAARRFFRRSGWTK